MHGNHPRCGRAGRTAAGHRRILGGYFLFKWDVLDCLWYLVPSGHERDVCAQVNL